MDEFLAMGLRRMNEMEESELLFLSRKFRKCLENNFLVFKRHAFRKHAAHQERRGVLNASFWDVMSTGLSHYATDKVKEHAKSIRDAVHVLLANEEFVTAITYGPNDPRKVKLRFEMVMDAFEEALGAYRD